MQTGGLYVVWHEGHLRGILGMSAGIEYKQEQLYEIRHDANRGVVRNITRCKKGGCTKYGTMQTGGLYEILNDADQPFFRELTLVKYFTLP